MSTQVATLHMWERGYIIHDKSASTLQDALDKCAALGGHLPSVHSKKDIDELGRFILRAAWLGARPEDKHSPSKSRYIFRWTDGSSFDYHEWKQEVPCIHSCCGVVLDNQHVNTRGLVALPCSALKESICNLPQLSSMSPEELIKISSRLVSKGDSDDRLSFMLDVMKHSFNALNKTTTKQLHESQLKIETQFKSFKVCLSLISLFLLALLCFLLTQSNLMRMILTRMRNYRENAGSNNLQFNNLSAKENPPSSTSPVSLV